MKNKRTNNKFINKTKKKFQNKNNYKIKKFANSAEKKNNYNIKYADTFTEDYNTNNNHELNYNNKLASNNPYNTNNKITYWALDSGASENITNQINILNNLKEHKEKIFLANGQYFQTEFIGSFKGYINDNEININEVYYSPNININLISISKLTQQNYKIVFNKYNNKIYVILYDTKGNIIHNIISNNINTFKIYISTQKINFQSINNNYNIINYTYLKHS